MGVRPSVFAGSWYPGSRAECEKVIEEFAGRSEPCPAGEKAWVGGIVPHAGWYFSGQTACRVIQCLKNGEPPDTVVIFGRHLHQGGANYIMKEGRWETPLGDLEIDQDLAQELVSEFKFTLETETRFEQDNTIELQLPFVKYFFPDSRILPIGVPPVPASLRIGERIAEMAGAAGKRMVILGSTDLTHYGYNYGFTPRGTGEEALRWVKEDNDRKVIELMLAMDAEGVIEESLRNHNACCPGAAAAAISAARRLGARKGKALVYTTSYDIRPDQSFVGYVGILF